MAAINSSGDDGSVMLRRIFLALFLCAAAAFGLYFWLTAAPSALEVTAPASAPDPANGQVIFNAGGCSSCHAVPGQPDRLKLGGGLAIPSPFGTFYAPNISPDPEDGIGRWSEADFVNALMKGISPTGEHYFPAFPYTTLFRSALNFSADAGPASTTTAPNANAANMVLVITSLPVDAMAISQQ